MKFAPIGCCWVCGGTRLTRFHECGFDFHEYAVQDPELHEYSAAHVWLVRCGDCGFGQPEQLPTLPRFFDRMYDQRAAEWIDGEFDADYKDFIFGTVLGELNRRLHRAPARTLLDVGAHAGRFMHLAQVDGWTVEGIELNPQTAAVAARRTGALVHRVNAHALAANGRRFAAVTLTDVLEHIPEPTRLLGDLAALVEPQGCIAIKVPCGPNQLLKEQMLARLTGHRVSVAENLVHVNHFSTRSLSLALERAGFTQVAVHVGAPELMPRKPVSWRGAVSNAVRRGLYAAASVPGAVHTPLALHLQAYATKADR